MQKKKSKEVGMQGKEINSQLAMLAGTVNTRGI